MSHLPLKQIKTLLRFLCSLLFEHMLDIPRILLSLALVMLLLIVAAAWSYDSAWATAENHPAIGTMEIGGQRAIDDAKHWLLGLAFGVVTISTLVVTLLLASGPDEFKRRRRIAICIGGLACLSVFVLTMLRYRDFAVGEPTLLGPFATPTTWMVFGLWSAPSIFVVIYCVTFKSWFADDDSFFDSEPN